MLVKRAVLAGSTLRYMSLQFKAGLAGQVEQELARRFKSSQLCTTITARFPLAEVSQAHNLMESGEHFGKIVLDVTS